MLPSVLLAGWTLWTLLILLHAAEVRWFGEELSLERAGQFGDAFGSLNALVAATAAAGALLTLREQRRAGLAHDNFVRKQSFENTFFQMINSLQDKTARIMHLEQFTYGGVENIQRVSYSGSAAFKFFLDSYVRPNLNPRPDAAGMKSIYEHLYDEEETNLGHYFRMVYHVLFYINSAKSYLSAEERYRYVRIVRSQLSHSELLIILMNCRYGKGREKFLHLATHYDLFQNLRESSDPLARILTQRLHRSSAEIVEIQQRDARLQKADLVATTSRKR
jgi:hypothetical protein